MTTDNPFNSGNLHNNNVMQHTPMAHAQPTSIRDKTYVFFVLIMWRYTSRPKQYYYCQQSCKHGLNATIHQKHVQKEKNPNDSKQVSVVMAHQHNI